MLCRSACLRSFDFGLSQSGMVWSGSPRITCCLDSSPIDSPISCGVDVLSMLGGVTPNARMIPETPTMQEEVHKGRTAVDRAIVSTTSLFKRDPCNQPILILTSHEIDTARSTTA
jgi:hypothetical protein